MTPEPTPSQELEQKELREILESVYKTGVAAGQLEEPLAMAGFNFLDLAEEQLLKLIDKEVTRSRIDELKLIPMVASKKVFVGVKAKDSLNVYLKQRLAELQAIQEEGIDNG